MTGGAAASGPRAGDATGAVADEVLRARAYLSRVAEPPAPALIAFVDAVGPRRGGRPGPSG